MNNKVSKISTIDRPESITLMSAIEDVINDIAPEKMTPIEVYGVLHFVAAKYLPNEKI